ncbi:MAG: hypothetical protein HKM23_06120 [Nitrosopumilus sp.]|nr:hypothetical protein [Nitrosopumilus sp.]NNM03297.1 hypothetical protein [Nitrosopumilus sp.]
MKKGAIVGIAAGIGIFAVIFAIVLSSMGESNVHEVEDTLDREVVPEEEITPEIQEKLDEVEKINLEEEYSPKPREWITSGPFQIDRSEYVLGEKIFLVIGGLNSQEKGQIAFLRPLNETHYSVYQTIPFDGAKKNAFNYYIEPSLSKANEICSMDDIVGTWTVVFRGTDYENLKFKITDKILPGVEDNYMKPVC